MFTKYVNVVKRSNFRTALHLVETHAGGTQNHEFREHMKNVSVLI